MRAAHRSRRVMVTLPAHPGVQLRRYDCGIVWDLLGVGILSMAAGHGRQLFPM
jgi:hypothetical protein